MTSMSNDQLLQHLRQGARMSNLTYITYSTMQLMEVSKAAAGAGCVYSILEEPEPVDGHVVHTVWVSGSSEQLDACAQNVAELLPPNGG